MISSSSGAPPPKPLILVVDDEIDITETYAMLFELHDFEVMTAGNGSEALAKIMLQTPDIIVSDCMMPMMGGVEMCERVRNMSSHGDIPIILCSGAPELHKLSHSRHDLFLKKPVMFETLLTEVKRLLQRK
ncbi:response regulator [Herbaspirillum lusitanum]|uniref:Response regulator n=1 Tax=Herbaspirillum lusitanum TaxID=213312 RepID=A0ABW9A6B4_9BURK